MESADINKILVPTDFSEPALKALRYAVGLASRLQAALTLLYVVEPAIYPAELGIAVNIEGDLMDRGREQITKLAAQECGAITTDTEVLTGVADLKIVETAEERGVDMIVMGTHGHSGLAHVLLGSTAERVVRKAPCPVLTIRSSE